MKAKILTSIILSAFSVSVLAQNIDSSWVITGTDTLTQDQLIALSKDSNYKDVVAKIKNAYKEVGQPVVNIKVDPKNKTIYVIEPKINANGSYASYFGNGTLSNKGIENSILRMKTEANLNGEDVSIDIKPVVGDTIPIDITTKPKEDYKPYGGSLIFNTMGQRYSGPDVLTAYGYYNIGNGQQINTSYSQGLQLSNDSKGGNFENETLSYLNATSYGVLSTNFTNTNYKAGGPQLPLDLTGQITSINIKDDYLFNKYSLGSGGLTYKYNKQNLGVLNIDDEQKYGYLTLSGAVFNKIDNFGFKVNIEGNQGFAGTESYSLVPFMGQFSSTWNTLKLDANSKLDFNTNGTAWVLNAGGQASADKTPNAEIFYLGGPNRGRAYTTGIIAMNNGWYASNQINAWTFKPAEGHSLTPFVGYDYAQASQNNLPTITLNSAFAGVQYAYKTDFTVNMGYAQSTSQDAIIQKYNVPQQRFDMLLTVNF